MGLICGTVFEAEAFVFGFKDMAGHRAFSLSLSFYDKNLFERYVPFYLGILEA